MQKEGGPQLLSPHHADQDTSQTIIVSNSIVAARPDLVHLLTPQLCLGPIMPSSFTFLGSFWGRQRTRIPQVTLFHPTITICLIHSSSLPPSILSHLTVRDQDTVHLASYHTMRASARIILEVNIILTSVQKKRSQFWKSIF